MAALLDTIKDSIGPDTVQHISKELGASEDRTATAISAILPAMIGGLSKNARHDEGAQELNQALERDHDGGLLDQLGSGGLMGVLGGILQGRETSPAGNPQGILNHVFGSKEDAVRQGAAQASGLDSGQAGRLMAMLAPLVMGALGKVKREKKLDAGGVKDLLSDEKNQLESKLPDEDKGGLNRFLDSNQDGRVNLSDDIAKVGMALGAAFLLGRGHQRG